MSGVTVHAAGSAPAVAMVRRWIEDEKARRSERDPEREVDRVPQDVPGRRRRKRAEALTRTSYAELVAELG